MATAHPLSVFEGLEFRAAWQMAATEQRDEEIHGCRVEQVLSFDDPNGRRTEIFWGPAIAERPFHSPQVPSGFLTGACGLRHVVFGTLPDAANENATGSPTCRRYTRRHASPADATPRWG
jgi:hypothetical protein